MAARAGGAVRDGAGFRRQREYFIVAAQRAVALFGFREALSLAERGLDGLDAMPAGPARMQLELGAADGSRVPPCARSRAGRRRSSNRRSRGRAQLCATQLGDPPPSSFPVLWNLALFHMIRGNLALGAASAADD